MTLHVLSRRLGVLARDVLEAILLAVVLFFVLQFALQSTVVEGSSMEPNLVDGEWVLVNKLAYRMGEPQRGDVIVFHAPGERDKDYIKRVVAVAGEEVVVRDGRLVVDGLPVAESWLPRQDPTAFGPYVVRPGEVVVFGDNRPNSNDSRLWPEPGLPDERIVGRVWISVWPPSAWGAVRHDGPGPARGAMRANAGAP